MLTLYPICIHLHKECNKCHENTRYFNYWTHHAANGIYYLAGFGKTYLSQHATFVNIIGAKQAKSTNTNESTAQMPEMILIVFIYNTLSNNCRFPDHPKHPYCHLMKQSAEDKNFHIPVYSLRLD